MGVFFVFFISYNYILYLSQGHTLLPYGSLSNALETGLGIVVSLFLAGVVKHLLEKYIQKRKVSLLPLK